MEMFGLNFNFNRGKIMGVIPTYTILGCFHIQTTKNWSLVGTEYQLISGVKSWNLYAILNWMYNFKELYSTPDIKDKYTMGNLVNKVILYLSYLLR